MNILGISHGGWDTAAALMMDGRIVAVCEQERYTGEKHTRAFPTEAVMDCLRMAGITLSDIDEVAFNFDPELIPEGTPRRATRSRPQYEQLVQRELGYSGPVTFHSHHECHVATAYYPSGFDRAIVASYDAIGENTSSLLCAADPSGLEVLHGGSAFPHSLGLVYTAITFYLGWKISCDEGIVMGLAGFGDPSHTVPRGSRTYEDVFREMIEVDGDFGVRINPEWFAYPTKRDTWISERFLSTFGPRRQPEAPVTQHHMDVAAAVQQRLETIVTGQLRRARELRPDHRRLCLAGGVALNCSMNGAIERMRIFDDIFVFWAAGDNGGCVGSCYLAQRAHDPGLRPLRFRNPYLGSGFDDAQIVQAATDAGLEAVRSKDVFADTAEHLAAGAIVGWFQGRSEHGPRALGNRSIITAPFPAQMKDTLNRRVKFREDFRPFAPAVLEDRASEFFELSQPSPHMLIAARARPAGLESIPATIHHDGTARVQTVSAADNDRFHRLLQAFEQRTQCPVLLNTSFNVKGQPIVNTPREAIDCFRSTEIDVLVLGDYVFDER
ncbi:MAG: carbamoyltransferase C-terminal domain-containing protein [Myxococcota bacterium]